MPNNPLKSLTRGLRGRMTDAETRMWFLLRNRQLIGAKFRRQVPLLNYVADFYCHEHRLVVEIDGGHHADNLRDQIRTRALEAEGCTVLRFWNDDVLLRQDAVLEKIIEVLASCRPSPALRATSPRGRGNSSSQETSK